MRGRLAVGPLAAVLLAGSLAADTPAPGFAVAARGASPSINPDPFGLSFDVHGVGIDLPGGR